MADFLFVHAGIRPGIPLEEQDPGDLLWIRDAFRLADAVFQKTVVFGHTVLPEPLLARDRIGIDTGAVFGGRITGIELPSRRLYQV